MQRPKLQWCDLPKELWQMIGKFLETRVDVLRFRSVCSLWRSALPPDLDPIDSPPLPLGFPHAGEEPPAAVSQTTVYRLQSLIAGEGSDESLPFLVKLEEANCGEMRLLHPITNWQLRLSITPTIKEFNLLDYRVVELVKLYSLKYAYTKIDVTYVNKVVVLPADHLSLGEDFVVFMIYRGGKLAVMRYGDESWIRVDENNSHYDDLIVYKGQCYVVDKWGTISWISQALQVIQYSPPLCGFGAHKHLVECCGGLCVVDRYLGSEPQRKFNYIHCDGEVVDFKVYRLDEEWATWVNVTNLGDQVIILSYDGAFSVSTRDFPGVKGNCIMFTEQDFGPLPAVIGMRSRSRHRRVFDLQDGSMSNIGYSQLFRTPSNWLTN
ncbi:F-box protein At4g35733-like [Rosa rugosa]|uniref:F-box protein At4g35733-like n=1 Tax=Rosa rugosa TaxID=74645 RepID=UPI002B412B30|nr:F-box protein At4g35733-like [Rosa rugosa]XP_061998366.1 F-box protein At4g35733-like [Rosa rugosa]XP_061998375.1 F-box protein At4g35733-like [Rosa rugosa]